MPSSAVSFFTRALCSVALSVLAFSAAAVDYPTKPVKIVVAYAAGGGADALARTIAERLAVGLKQPVVVENRPGAGGIPAADMVAKSPADGYTLLLTDTQLVITPSLFDKVPFDTKKDLAPVSLMTTVPFFLAVKTDSGVTSLQDLIAKAKASPGKLNYGSAGIGSLHHISMESFKNALGLDIVHVPYRGSGNSIAGFLSNDVTVLVASLPSMLPHIKAGNVKLLAATSSTRSPHAPDVPSIAEVVPGYDFSTEIGLLAPSGTPKDVVNKLSGAILEALKDPATVDRIHNVMGASVVGSSPDAYAKNIDINLGRYAKAVKVSGAKVE